jgi:PAS domain-containing protein
MAMTGFMDRCLLSGSCRMEYRQRGFHPCCPCIRSVEESPPAIYAILSSLWWNSIQLKTEASCLKCHASQGYKVGDIRGGISVSIPMQPFYTLLETGRMRLSVIQGGVWLFFSGLIVLGGRRLQMAQQGLATSENRFRELFENMKSGVAVCEAIDGGSDFIIRDFNRAAEGIGRCRIRHRS